MKLSGENLSGAHRDLFPRIVVQLQRRQLDDLVLVCGGIIPDDDIPAIKEMGFAGVFGPGASTQEIAAFIRAHVAQKRGARAA